MICGAGKNVENTGKVRKKSGTLQLMMTSPSDKLDINSFLSSKKMTIVFTN